MKISISREEWERKADKLLKGLATSRIENNKDITISDKDIISDCTSIKVNGVIINATAFTVSSKYINFGEVESADIIDGKTDKKIGTRYFIDDDKAVARIMYNPIKTLVFEQEIGTSGRKQQISIYIKDKYSTVKEMLEELGD